MNHDISVFTTWALFSIILLYSWLITHNFEWPRRSSDSCLVYVLNKESYNAFIIFLLVVTYM